MNNLHRLFVAINLPEKIKNRLAVYQNQWPELPARWVKTENFHITIDFLGNVADQEVCEICALAAQVAKRHEPFDITLQRVVYGPENKIPPRMVWAVGEISDELGKLKRDLENTMYEFAGADSQEGNAAFAPHVTLARLNRSGFGSIAPEEMPVIDENIGYTFLAESIEVMESALKRGGPQYTILESAKLGEY